MDLQIRHWDSADKYVGAVLKWYEHWCLEVSYRQHTLGCYILFCRREGVRLPSDLHDEELLGLREAMSEIELALRAHSFFDPDHFNYLQMGNALPLLHFHGIPRYLMPRNFDGMTWVDKRPGHPPVWKEHEAPRVLIEKLRVHMSKHL